MSKEMDTTTRLQIQDETVCIPRSANTLRKGMNSIILPPAMSKIVGQTVFFNFGMATMKGKKNSDLKPV